MLSLRVDTSRVAQRVKQGADDVQRERGKLIFVGVKSRRKIIRLDPTVKELLVHSYQTRDSRKNEIWWMASCRRAFTVGDWMKLREERVGNKGSHSISQRAPVRRFKRSYKFRLFLARSARINRTGHNAFIRVDDFPGRLPSLFHRTYVSFALAGVIRDDWRLVEGSMNFSKRTLQV